MRLGIDARPLQHETQYRGIGRALESLLSALTNYLTADDSLIFFVDDGLAEPAALKLFPQARVIKVPTARLGRKRYFRSFLPSFKLIQPSPKDIDVLLQYDASFGIPKSVPTVVVFHDLIPLLFRGQEKRRPTKGLRKAKDNLAGNMYWQKYLRVLKSYKHAASIIAISNSSKKDLLKYVDGIDKDKVTVISHGMHPKKRSGNPSQKIKKLASSPYLLYVGGIDIRKNILGLLQTFYELKVAHPDLKLITVGKEFELEDQLAGHGWFGLLNSRPDYAKDVILPGFVSAGDLDYLYSHAAAFVFASRYEGFGLPVLEAMRVGCPVVAYDNSSIPEVAGDAALLVKDGEPLAPAVDKLLRDPKLRQQLITKGEQRVKKFPWTESAQKTIELLRQAAKN